MSVSGLRGHSHHFIPPEFRLSLQSPPRGPPGTQRQMGWSESFTGFGRFLGISEVLVGILGELRDLEGVRGEGVTERVLGRLYEK